MLRNRYLFVIRVFSGQKKPICLKMQICIERIGENAILIHFMLLYLIYVHLEDRRTFQTQIIDDFPVVWSYGKLPAKYFVSSLKVIDTVGFCRFS